MLGACGGSGGETSKPLYLGLSGTVPILLMLPVTCSLPALFCKHGHLSYKVSFVQDFGLKVDTPITREMLDLVAFSASTRLRLRNEQNNSRVYPYFESEV